MTINKLDFVNYDLDSLIIQLQSRLRSRYPDSWQDIYRSGNGEMLIEFLAAVVGMGLYYTERRAEESYIDTALNRSSIVNLVSLLNYQPKRKTSATGNLLFTRTAPLTKIVYIPKYTACASVDGVKYLTNESATIEKGQNTVTVIGIQGERAQTEITSDGSLNQEYLINDTTVENSADTNNPTFKVTIDGVEWTKVTTFLNSENIDKHYKLINEMEGTVTVKFGDNINGLAPSASSRIVIQYIKSGGLSGNVTFTDKITTVSSTIYDEDGTIVTVTVTNTSAFLGGDDEEDIEEIRYEGPRVFKTGDRAVSRNDFIAILENYPGVANANVWGENEEALEEGVDADYEMLNKVKMCIVLQNWDPPDAPFKNTLSDYIYEKSMLTVKYEYVTPVVLDVIPTLDVKVTTGYSMSQTQADIEEVLADQFTLGTTTKLGTTIKYSNVISAINDLDGVAWVNGVLEIKKDLSDIYSSLATFGETLDAIPILTGSVRVFIADEYVTTDDDGIFSYSHAGTTIGGTVNYTTGVVLLTINPVPTGVYVRYQQAGDSDRFGNIVPTLHQICKLDSTDIVNIEMQ